MKYIDAIHGLERLWADAGEDREWFKHSKMREIAVNFAKKLDELEAAVPEALPTFTKLAMDDAPTIRDVVMRVMRDHYWDSLEPQRDLVLLHIEAALKWFGPPKQSQPQDGGQ